MHSVIRYSSAVDRKKIDTTCGKIAIDDKRNALQGACEVRPSDPGVDDRGVKAILI